MATQAEQQEAPGHAPLPARGQCCHQRLPTAWMPGWQWAASMAARQTQRLQPSTASPVCPGKALRLATARVVHPHERQSKNPAVSS